MRQGPRKPNVFVLPEFHMPAMPTRPDTPEATRTGQTLKPANTFGPATYYRLGVRVPGGPPKRGGSRG